MAPTFKRPPKPERRLRSAQIGSRNGLPFRFLTYLGRSAVSVLVGINEGHVVKLLHWKILTRVHSRNIQGIAHFCLSGWGGEVYNVCLASNSDGYHTSLSPGW